MAGDTDVGLLYEQLRTVASAYFRSEPAGHTLQPTALVNEAMIRLLKQGALDAGNREHLVAMAARHMRNILVDHARKRRALKRGRGLRRVTLSGLAMREGPPLVDVLHLHEVLERLSTLNSRQAQIVELRLFAGLTNLEIAHTVGLSERTVERDWRFLRAWLSKALTEDDRR